MMIVRQGNAMSFTPDHSGNYMVRFTSDDGKEWTEAVIGWAVVAMDRSGEVTWTSIEPVVIDDDDTDGWPSTVSEYRDNRSGPISWRVVRHEPTF